MLLIQDVFQGILSLFLQEFKNKNRFETQKDDLEFPFFVLAKSYFNEDLNGDELTGIWTEFIRNLARTTYATNQLSMTTKRNIETLAQHTPQDFNFIEYKSKTKVVAVCSTDLLFDRSWLMSLNWCMTLRCSRILCTSEWRKWTTSFVRKMISWPKCKLNHQQYLQSDYSKQDEGELRELKARHRELELVIAKEGKKNFLPRKSKDIEAEKREHTKVTHYDTEH